MVNGGRFLECTSTQSTTRKVQLSRVWGGRGFFLSFPALLPSQPDAPEPLPPDGRFHRMSCYRMARGPFVSFFPPLTALRADLCCIDFRLFCSLCFPGVVRPSGLLFHARQSGPVRETLRQPRIGILLCAMDWVGLLLGFPAFG